MEIGMVLLRALPGISVCLCLQAQVIEFDSNGLRYKTLTRAGVTVMFATLPVHIRDYSVLQVAVSNGSLVSWNIKPEDFNFQRSDGEMLQASNAQDVVLSFIKHSGRSDVIKLVSTYENGLYGNIHMRLTNGYEARRQNALAEVSSARLKAGAAGIRHRISADQAGSRRIHRWCGFLRSAGESAGPGAPVGACCG